MLRRNAACGQSACVRICITGAAMKLATSRMAALHADGVGVVAAASSDDRPNARSQAQRVPG